MEANNILDKIIKSLKINYILKKRRKANVKVFKQMRIMVPMSKQLWRKESNKRTKMKY